MQNEAELFDKLRNVFMELSINGSSTRENQLPKLILSVHNKYGIPNGLISDVITLRVDLEDAAKEIIYAIIDILNDNYSTYIDISKYFFPQEIKACSKYRYIKESGIQFPFTFESPMVEIKDHEQYIGKTTVKELMKLRDAQVIKYNDKTQRTLERRQNKEFEYYRIALNRNAISKISELMQMQDYVPNTLTFNLAPETEFVYKNNKLTIMQETSFDILDGYHRFVAMSNLYNNDNEFDYPMEIRIMFLTEENARQFIFQEDQRTPLARVDVEAMNKNDAGVRVCKAIKNNLGNSVVNNQKGIINEAILIRLIDLLYIDKDKTYKQSMIIGLAKEITDIINGVLYEVPVLLDEPWSNNFTVLLLSLAAKKDLRGLQLYETATQKAVKLGKEEKIDLLTVKRINKLINL